MEPKIITNAQFFKSGGSTPSVLQCVFMQTKASSTPGGSELKRKAIAAPF
jgi:hypothetical protein